MTNRRLKDAYVELCQRYGPNYYITLATNQPWSSDRMTVMLNKFAQSMDQSGLGRKWFKKPIFQRADGICFIEKPNTNLHAHCVLRIPYLPPNISEAWERICPSGSADIQEITTEGFGAYCAKEMELRRFRPDQIVLLSDFMSATSQAALNTSLR